MKSPLLSALAALAVCSTQLRAAEGEVSFTREVIPAFTKVGCNSGSCHGTPSGKNGFRLSLRGYDPAIDILSLTRELGGRRIDLQTPESSLILQKATARAPHEGGRKLDPDGELYRLVREWIARGANDDRASSPRPVALEISPAKKIIDAPASSERLRVVARFPEGAQVDVTHLARFAVSDETGATIQADGTVTRLKPGEVVIVGEYMGLMSTAVLLFRDARPEFRWPNPPERNYIDTHVFAKLKLLQIEPAPLSTDAEFCRRAYLDAVGRLPTPVEVRAFLKDTDPKKRARLIETLLALPEFADWWALKWADRLGVNQRFVGKIGAVKYHQWVRGMMAANVPEDEFARTILTSSGGNYSTPPAGFFRRLRDPMIRGEEIAQLFMGVRIQCAKCHNHPGENWTQDDYYGLAAFFNRVRYRDGPFFIQIYDKEETIWTPREGELTHPRTGAIVRAKFPGGPAPVLAPDADRRAAFADWLTSATNPYFARASANRIWFHLFGRGIVDPVDDVRRTNPPAIPALLDALADDLVKHHFDRKHLIRTIMNSRVYQASGEKTPTNADDTRYFSRSVPRRLGAEALLDAISDATGSPEKFRDFPPGRRAIQIADGEFKHPVLENFGKPARATVCECERESEVTLYGSMSLVGGDFLQSKLSDPAGRVAALAASSRSDRDVIEELFLATLSRRPSTKELERLLAFLAKDEHTPRQKRYEDVLYALLNHIEFQFQH
ncbi:MAG TPA: DUF1549 and DUF1553 domain-containing protein [Gemmata sp.]|nr:DUF1549 and DUF1553 domain-containing protein [Gemmata sp.]